MKTAEILGFVSTPDGDVVLEPLGKHFLEADMNGRKLIMREQLKKHGLFATSSGCCAGRRTIADQEVVLEHLAMLLPNEKPEPIFDDRQLGTLRRAFRL